MKTVINITFILTLVGLAVATYYKDELISGYSRTRDSVMSDMFGDDTPTDAPWKRYLKASYVLLDEDRHSEAGSAARRAIGLAETTSGIPHTDVIACYRALAYVQISLEQYDGADKTLAKAMDVFEKSGGTDNAVLAGLLKDRGDNHVRLGKSDEATDAYTKILEIGDATPDSAHAMVSLGNIHFAKGEHKKAESFLSQAVESMSEILKPESPEAVSAMISLGHIKMLNKEYDAAQSLFNRAIKIRTDAFGEDDPGVAEGLVSLSILCEAREKYDRAASALEQALRIINEKPDPESERLAFVENRLGRLRR